MLKTNDTGVYDPCSNSDTRLVQTFLFLKYPYPVISFDPCSCLQVQDICYPDRRTLSPKNTFHRLNNSVNTGRRGKASYQQESKLFDVLPNMHGFTSAHSHLGEPPAPLYVPHSSQLFCRRRLEWLPASEVTKPSNLLRTPNALRRNKLHATSSQVEGAARA